MRYSLLNILACPICKYFPLKLYIFNEQKLPAPQSSIVRPLCDIFCGLHRKYINELDTIPNCIACIQRDIVWGILFCEKCGRWYPIISGVPLLYPDDIRLKTRIRFIEKAFIKRFKGYIPDEIVHRDPLKLIHRYSSDVHENR
ncbi:protein of unknown function DUF343 [Ignisphaera aggregans DSM 17230]|uniref:Trm112 family protein n=1 Tax=Ignisphaera aggregans (strain DSM 17230 / JCM 13409 / AQ1.S1) TaxID=583356 RepID=E0SSM7_IGNAA|nr:protein of unknown function DUF343 [Ignisphaera aggregans DSM 17230]